jgi:hypothetical protein
MDQKNSDLLSHGPLSEGGTDMSTEMEYVRHSIPDTLSTMQRRPHPKTRRVREPARVLSAPLDFSSGSTHIVRTAAVRDWKDLIEDKTLQERFVELMKESDQEHEPMTNSTAQRKTGGKGKKKNAKLDLGVFDDLDLLMCSFSCHP